MEKRMRANKMKASFVFLVDNDISKQGKILRFERVGQSPFCIFVGLLYNYLKKKPISN